MNWKYIFGSPTYTITFYQDTKKETRWRATHRNGNVIADGGEGYKNAGDARTAFTNLAGGVDGDKYQVNIFHDKKKEFRWDIVHINGNVIADSGEGYKNWIDAVTALFNLSQALLSGDYRVVES